MSEQFTEVEDRIISGLGIIQIPQEPDWRAFQLFINLVRPPNPDYLNYKWNPPRGEYAKVAWMDNEYVFKEDVIHYPKWRYQWHTDEDANYINLAFVCLYQSLSNRINQILTILGSPPGSPPGVAPSEGLLDRVTQIQFSCREESAFQLVLKGLKYDVSCAEATPAPKIVPPPENELPQVPSGDSIGVSPPYEDPDDNGNTIPFDGDEIDLPPTEQTYRVNSRGLQSGCQPRLDIWFQETLSATTISWDNRPIPAGQQYAGCSYDFLVVDGVSRYPSVAGGSSPGLAYIQLLDAQGNVVTTYSPGQPVPPN